MKKEKILLSVTVASMIAAGAIFAINGGLKSSLAFATSGEVWHHYAAVAPTETTHGSKEFWASSVDGCTAHTFTDPGPGVTCEEHDFSKYDSFATLTCDDDRYVPSGNESLGIAPMFSTKNKTVTYGLYPQKNVNDSSLVSALNALTTPESNGWYLYENEYYAKLSATPCTVNSFTSKFDNGTTIVSGTKYWFKCEPITWKVLSNTNGEYYILSSLLLDAHRYDDDSNNYKDSEIRSFLNNDFYNSAFALGSSHIQTTTVDNSTSTTGYSGNTYACANTEDNVFLPSYKDYKNSSYGFSISIESTDTRYCKTTDWARARGAWYSTDSSYLYNGQYWTRSPYVDSGKASYVQSNGYISSCSVLRAYVSVRPAIKIA